MKAVEVLRAAAKQKDAAFGEDIASALDQVDLHKVLVLPHRAAHIDKSNATPLSPEVCRVLVDRRLMDVAGMLGCPIDRCDTTSLDALHTHLDKRLVDAKESSVFDPLLDEAMRLVSGELDAYLLEGSDEVFLGEPNFPVPEAIAQRIHAAPNKDLLQAIVKGDLPREWPTLREALADLIPTDVLLAIQRSGATLEFVVDKPAFRLPSTKLVEKLGKSKAEALLLSDEHASGKQNPFLGELRIHLSSDATLAQIVQLSLHELGHALDDVLGSKDKPIGLQEPFRALFEQTKKKRSGLHAPTEYGALSADESFAEAFALLLFPITDGGFSAHVTQTRAHFRRRHTPMFRWMENLLCEEVPRRVASGDIRSYAPARPIPPCEATSLEEFRLAEFKVAMALQEQSTDALRDALEALHRARQKRPLHARLLGWRLRHIDALERDVEQLLEQMTARTPG